MLIYNISYHLNEAIEENFLIWIKEIHIPDVEKEGTLKNPRLCKILSHREAGEVSYTLQWEVEDAASLHRWHIKMGNHAASELMKIFKEKVLFFETLMRVEQ